jgi:hypothetical protein
MTRLSGRRKLLAALAIALVIAGVLIAVLGGSGRPPTGRNVPGQPARSAGRGEPAVAAGRAELAAAADYLGVSQSQLRASLRAGTSLAEVAASHGRSVTGLEQRLVAARTSALAKALHELPAQTQQLVRARIQRSVAVSVKRHRVGGPTRVAINVRIASRYLGVKARELRAQLRRGRTLAQVAASSPGRSASGLIAALLAARKQLLDRARAAGEITPAVEQHALTTLKQRLTAAVNSPPGR